MRTLLVVGPHIESRAETVHLVNYGMVGPTRAQLLPAASVDSLDAAELTRTASFEVTQFRRLTPSRRRRHQYLRGQSEAGASGWALNKNHA